MGSVNTVIVTHSESGRRSLHGENTDWQGISRCITRGLTTKNSNATGVVVGAGGAARAAVFAMIKLEIPVIYVVNRTLERARALAATFPGHDVRVFGSIKELVESTSVPLSVIVGWLCSSGCFAGGRYPCKLFLKSRPRCTCGDGLPHSEQFGNSGSKISWLECF
ncbi:hypothetical protein BDV97DRAFT_345864 [Delphinella strobiligena]|nr:hypothetical protein BDV97DRAFT_345864 [Delphinella strobiligena]